MHTPIFAILLLCGMIGNLVLPYSWGWIWKRYHPLKTDTILLSDPDCPLCWIQRLWRLALGTTAILGGITFFQNIQSNIFLNLFLLLALLIYGVFGCVLPAVLSLTDIKYVESGAAKLHNLFYFCGHACLLISAFLCGSAFFEHGHGMTGALCMILSFAAVFLYILYIMSDRLELKDTIIAYEGIWEFGFHLLAYLPIGIAIISMLNA